jgi:hypothetical protein
MDGNRDIEEVLKNIGYIPLCCVSNHLCSSAPLQHPPQDVSLELRPLRIGTISNPDQERVTVTILAVSGEGGELMRQTVVVGDNDTIQLTLTNSNQSQRR